VCKWWACGLLAGIRSIKGKAGMAVFIPFCVFRQNVVKAHILTAPHLSAHLSACYDVENCKVDSYEVLILGSVNTVYQHISVLVEIG
jgi:hypothetical protein